MYTYKMIILTIIYYNNCSFEMFSGIRYSSKFEIKITIIIKWCTHSNRRQCDKIIWIFCTFLKLDGKRVYTSVTIYHNQIKWMLNKKIQ